MKKSKRIASVFMFIFMLNSISLWSIPVYSAAETEVFEENLIEYNYTDEEVDKIIDEEFPMYSRESMQRGLLSALALLALKNIIKKYGARVAKGISVKAVAYGVNQACKRWNDSNKAWDYFCDFQGRYFD